MHLRLQPLLPQTVLLVCLEQLLLPLQTKDSKVQWELSVMEEVGSFML